MGRGRGTGRGISNPTSVPTATQGEVLPVNRLVDDSDNSLTDNNSNYLVY